LSARYTYRFANRHRERTDGINLDVMLIAGKASLLAHWLDAEKRSLPYAEQLMRAREWLRARGVGFDQRASRWATWMLPTQVLGAAGYHPDWLSSSALCPWHTPQEDQEEMYSIILEAAESAGPGCHAHLA